VAQEIWVGEDGLRRSRCGVLECQAWPAFSTVPRCAVDRWPPYVQFSLLFPPGGRRAPSSDEMSPGSLTRTMVLKPEFRCLRADRWIAPALTGFMASATARRLRGSFTKCWRPCRSATRSLPSLSSARAKGELCCCFRVPIQGHGRMGIILAPAPDPSPQPGRLPERHPGVQEPQVPATSLIRFGNR